MAETPQDLKREKCPDCPDGQVWTRKGPTDEICPTCKGTAFVWVAAELGDSHE